LIVFIVHHTVALKNIAAVFFSDSKTIVVAVFIHLIYQQKTDSFTIFSRDQLLINQ